jgi:cellulose synthase/poly-beta-1,6-N-acetylglucosamine synthase-like glycosyltransferase
MSIVILAAAVFWCSALAVVYAYAGYPLLLLAIQAIRRSPGPFRTADTPYALPSVSLIIPVHNERSALPAKLENTRQLQYPHDRLEIIFVSDGSSDGSNEVLRAETDPRIRLLVLESRKGKASALNAGLAAATGDLVVFSDASIALDPDSLVAIVRPFQDAAIGCVSGEDRIAGQGGEGLYGRYELYLRRQESLLHSIVGASGSFYAQRRVLCEPFLPGLAPDFLSVLRTVERGYRAIAQPRAGGSIEAVQDPRDEFARKVRTILRGITTLGAYARLLNPFGFGWFAFELLSHKIARWSVPFFLVWLLAANVALAPRSLFFAATLLVQLAFYGVGLAASTGAGSLAKTAIGRISGYFTTVNLATLSAWAKFAAGTRQELWSPSRR